MCSLLSAFCWWLDLSTGAINHLTCITVCIRKWVSLFPLGWQQETIQVGRASNSFIQHDLDSKLRKKNPEAAYASILRSKISLLFSCDLLYENKWHWRLPQWLRNHKTYCLEGVGACILNAVAPGPRTPQVWVLGPKPVSSGSNVLFCEDVATCMELLQGSPSWVSLTI